MKAGIVDYGMGNLASVSKALERAGAATSVSDDAKALGNADVLVLPGVGNFESGVSHLEKAGLGDFVKDWAAGEKPLLGICLGMQLLFEESEEGDARGLGILPGRVVKLTGDIKVPHMGWNSIEATGGSSLFQSFSGRSFYFVHSFVCTSDAGLPGAHTTYGRDFLSAVQAGNVVGVQFHPEKSSHDGIALLERCLEAVS